MIKLKGLHSPSDLAVFGHAGCGRAARCYITKVLGVVGLRDPEKAVCPGCGEPFTMAQEVTVKHSELYPILGT